MRYLRRGYDALTNPDSSYVEGLRFVRDTFNGLAATALIGAGVAAAEVGDNRRTVVVALCLGASALGSGGAWVSRMNIDREQYYNPEDTSTQ